MINPNVFVDSLLRNDINFYTGVPDSLLKSLCAYITDNIDEDHNIITANEGAAVALASGYYLATKKIPVVFMQNSGEGNAINPLASLVDKDVYNIPILLVIGWRGEPGIKDEPQHIKQGKITLQLLDVMGVKYTVLDDNQDFCEVQIKQAVDYIKQTNEPYAFIVKKDTFGPYKLVNSIESNLTLSREDAIKMVTSVLDDNSVIISTTGMISRELFEFRESVKQDHYHDFLTVGSMGHASQIALGIAMQKQDKKVFCFDGDGAAIMHMGSMAIIGTRKPFNYFHILFNNGAHDSVGGQPTVGLKVDFPGVAKALGYETVLSVSNQEELNDVLKNLAKYKCPVFLEIKVKKGNRNDLGRPTITPKENKESLMNYLK